MMKNNYIYICLTVIVGCLLLSCIHENPHGSGSARKAGELTVTLAQEEFQDMSQELTVTGVNTETGIPVFAIWDHAKSYRTGDTQIVQAPINVAPSYSYNEGSADSIFHRIIANTITFLVAQKEDGQKDITYRVVRFFAEDDWLMDNPRKLFSLSLSSLDNYTGKVLYYDIYGQLLEGAAYEVGEQTGII